MRRSNERCVVLEEQLKMIRERCAELETQRAPRVSKKSKAACGLEIQGWAKLRPKRKIKIPDRYYGF